MKIYKFNESTQDNWTVDKLQKLHDDKSDLQDLVLEFLYLYKGKEEFRSPNIYFLIEFWFEDDGNSENSIFSVSFEKQGYHRGETVYYEFSKDEYEELLMFMNNPEMYKNSKKYNL